MFGVAVEKLAGMAGAGGLPFGIVLSILLVIHFDTLPSAAGKELGEYVDVTEGEEANAALAMCQAELLQKVAQVARTEAELARKESELAQSRTRLAQKESELAEKAADWSVNCTQLAEPSPKPPIAEADPQRFLDEFNSSQVHLGSVLTGLADKNATLMESMGIQSTGQSRLHDISLPVRTARIFSIQSTITRFCFTFQPCYQ